MSKKHYIYGLREKDRAEIRYIGCTTNPKQRLDCHRNLRDDMHRTGGNPRFTAWLRSRDIEMCILDEADDFRSGRRAEEMWMRAYRAIGNDLLNERASLNEIMTRKERVQFLSRWLDKHEETF